MRGVTSGCGEFQNGKNVSRVEESAVSVGNGLERHWKSETELGPRRGILNSFTDADATVEERRVERVEAHLHN